MKKKIELKVKETIKKVFNKELEIQIETPPKLEMGDFAIPCFNLAEKIGEGPNKIANQIKSNFPELNFIKEVKVIGPYLNFTIKKKNLFGETLKSILNSPDDYFLPSLSEEKVMIEFVSPNNNKPLHLGHVRNACLGDATAKILKSCGKKVIKTYLINDKGIPIFKNILAWEKWHPNEAPADIKKKPDHFLGDLYVKYEQKKKENPNLEEEVQELEKKWENKDKKTLTEWKMMNDWFLKGFKESIKKLNISFDLIQKESELYKEGKKIVEQGIEKDLFKKEGEGIIFTLPEDKFGLDPNEKPKFALLLRNDGTSLYLTQDLGVAVKRFKEYNLDQLIYVVGSEQKEHFQRLFTILEALEYKWSKNCFHLSYGLVDLPEGSMSSRKGNVVTLDELVEKIKKLAKKEIKKRHELTEEKIEERSKKIMNAAIKFYLLKVNSS
ncbi:MAG: arginine--tRNA ligase, partial [Minisyncoccales bacterium]